MMKICKNNIFSKDFDALNSGRLTVSQFHRGLDILGISGIQRLYLSLPEIEAIMIQYQDPCDPTRVCWKTFEDDINQVFTTKELEKYPCLELDVPPLDVIELPRMGGKDWQKVNTVQRELCEEAVDKVKKRVTNRRIVLKPSFRDYDKYTNFTDFSGHIVSF